LNLRDLKYLFVKMQWYRSAKIFCNICWNIYLPVTNKHPS